MKYLLTFEKGEPVRWLGHLDMLRTFERAIRRAELPIAFTTGFNPREKITFASALGVGVTGSAELLTLELTDPVDPPAIVAQLNEKLPAGIRIVDTREIPEAGSRDLLNSYDRAELFITCTCQDDVATDSVQSAVESLLAQGELIVQREKEGRTRQVDIRQWIHELNVESRADDRTTFRAILSVSQEGSARPQEIITLLAEQLSGLALRRVHRVRMISSAEVTSSL